MNRLRSLPVLALLGSLVLGSTITACGGGGSTAAKTTPATGLDAKTTAPCPTDGGDARSPRRSSAQILQAFAASHPLTPENDPLRHPKTLDDVDAILHLDQLDLFAGAEDFAATLPGNEALALRAQIEIAQSEAQLMVASLLSESVASLVDVTRTLRFRQSSGLTSNEERAKLDELLAAEREAREVAGALREQAGDRARDGADLTRKLMERTPDSYRAHRVAADYHRLRGDWKAFADDLVALEKSNPKSNGLLFLAALALQEEGRVDDATKLLRKSIERDPRFVRAQAHLVLLQTSPDGAAAELGKLRAMNPRHQLVAFAGPFIDAANKAWSQQHKAPARWSGQTSL